jgi:phenylalanyl-tRNA synthetase beta chain
MLISYNWLKQITPTKLSPSELREKLTMVGLAIDAVETHGDDSVIDVEVPSNRPDCLSHVGIAREVAVIESGEYKLPESIQIKTEGKSSELTSVEIKDPDLCPRYSARLVRGVKIAPSPEWLIKSLETIGQRPINNVADITNYVLHELGQPLHAFDFDRLQGKRIVVRRALPGEKLKTLDGIERMLTGEMLVIADSERAVAMAGIMGGEDSEISSNTVDVLIESAYFDPDSVRRTARKLGMDTEASRRFERGADRENVLRAQQRCVELICELAGGVATEDTIDEYPNPVSPREVNFCPARVKELSSISVETKDIERILNGLGFETTAQTDSTISYRVPSWRNDVEREEDLVEEVARHVGYDLIGSELPPASASGEYQPGEVKQRMLRRTLNGLGYDEAITFSFIGPHDEFELIPGLGAAPQQPELKNPIIEDASRMRSTLLAGLLNSVRHNLNHGQRDVRLFEVGRVFAQSEPGQLPVERLAFALVATGGALEENRAQADHEIDFFDFKGAVEAAIDSMNFSPLTFAKGTSKHLRPGQSAVMSSGDVQIGTIGRLAESIAANYKFRQPVYVAELDLSQLLDGAERVVQYTPLPRYPSVVRDLSLLVSRDVSLDQIRNAIAKQGIEECRSVKFVGTFEGGNIPASKRSVTLRLEYRAGDRTLRDAEVEEQHSHLTSVLLQEFSAEQR